MKITKRLYAYPVLAADKDDYRKAIFSVEMSEHMELTDFVLHFSVQLTSESLIRMIGQGEAEYLIHIECSSTAFRKAYHFASPQFEVRIPLEKINHMVEIVAFVKARGGMDYAVARLDEYVDKAIAALDVLPQGEDRQALADLARFVSERKS